MAPPLERNTFASPHSRWAVKAFVWYKGSLPWPILLSLATLYRRMFVRNENLFSRSGVSLARWYPSVLGPSCQ